MNVIEQRLEFLGISLPQPAKPVANYVPWVKSGNLIFLAGQLPMKDGAVQNTGPIDGGVASIEAAKLCGINLLAQLREACGGDLMRVKQVLKLVVFAQCADFEKNIPFAANGASDLMVAAFGDKGKHARSSVGVSALPLNAMVEVEAIVEIE